MNIHQPTHPQSSPIIPHQSPALLLSINMYLSLSQSPCLFPFSFKYKEFTFLCLLRIPNNLRTINLLWTFHQNINFFFYTSYLKPSLSPMHCSFLFPIYLSFSFFYLKPFPIDLSFPFSNLKQSLSLIHCSFTFPFRVNKVHLARTNTWYLLSLQSLSAIAGVAVLCWCYLYLSLL